MVLPVTAPIARQAYETLQNLGINAISYARQVQSALALGDVPSQALLNLLSSGLATLAYAQQLQANTALAPALIAYVQQQNGQPTLDVATALSTSMTALATLTQAIVAAYPKDTNGTLLDRSFDAQGSVVPITLAPASLGAVGSAITAWLATIA